MIERIVKLDEAGRYLLPFARSKLAQLWNARSPLTHKGSASSVSSGPRGEIVRVSIVGGVGRIYITASFAVSARLYEWVSLDEGTATELDRVRLLANAPSASKTVTAVVLTALAPGMALSARESWLGDLFQITVMVRHRARLFEQYVLEENIFALEMLHMIFEAQAFLLEGVPFEPLLDDCLISRPVAGDFTLLLGSFPVADASGTNPDNRLTTQNFTGIKVVWSALKPRVIGTEAVRFGSGVGEVPYTAVAAAEYQRLNPIDAENPAALSTGALQWRFERNHQLPFTSPFVRAYHYFFREESDTGVTPPRTRNVEQGSTYTAHTLLLNGTIVQSDMLAGVVTGAGVGSVDNSGGPPNVVTWGFDPIECALTFYDGERFVRYGTANFSTDGTTNFDSYFIDYTSKAPLIVGGLSANDYLGLEVLAYVPSHNLLVSGPGGTDIDVAVLLGDPSLPYDDTDETETASATDTLGAMDITSGRWIAQPDISSVEFYSQDAPPNAPSYEEHNIVTAGLGTRLDLGANETSLLQPQGRTVPRTIRGGAASDDNEMGGIYWPRAGDMGVFFFKFPVDAGDRADRAALVTDYRTKHFASTFADGERETMLASIAALTTVVVNNFAAPVLYPWITEGMVGVLIDNL